MNIHPSQENAHNAQVAHAKIASKYFRVARATPKVAKMPYRKASVRGRGQRRPTDKGDLPLRNRFGRMQFAPTNKNQIPSVGADTVCLLSSPLIWAFRDTRGGG